MIHMRPRHAGVTLLEALLVLAIGISFVLLGLRQYNSYRLDADIMQLNANIDTLFQAAANYYKANCPKGKALDPTIATGSTKTLNITTDLLTPRFLESTFPIASPLVDSSAPGGGYAVQFNKSTAPRMQQVCANPPTCSSLTSDQIGTVVFWKIQVSVHLLNTSAAQLEVMKKYLNADSTTATDVVFVRLPAFASSKSDQSVLWPSMPLVKQFNQMYTTNPITDLTNQDHSTEYQYFYCSS
jgi:hypothetical protein